MTPGSPLAIVGPTASGKTALSIELARRLRAEIISMDSRQIYRGMDIGTAKPTPAQRAAVPHHGIDIIDPDDRFSAGAFGRLAREWIDDIAGRGRLPLLVGGTGFFLRALTHPIFSEPPLDSERREALQVWFSRLESSELRRWLTLLDPEAGERLGKGGGRQRLLRALEIPLLTGHSLSWWHRNAAPEAEPVRLRVFVVDLPRDRLYRAIDDRVGEMASGGLLDEVKGLLERGYTEHDPGMTATGYAELIPVVRGEVPLEKALDDVRKRTRAYARRQITWFRHQLPSGSIWLDGTRPTAEMADEIVEVYSRPEEESRQGMQR